MFRRALKAWIFTQVFGMGEWDPTVSFHLACHTYHLLSFIDVTVISLIVVICPDIESQAAYKFNELLALAIDVQGWDI